MAIHSIAVIFQFGQKCSTKPRQRDRPVKNMNITNVKPIQHQLLWPPKLLQSYLSQLDLITHEDEDLCGVGGGCGSISVVERLENKAQTELSNTPFH